LLLEKEGGNRRFDQAVRRQTQGEPLRNTGATIRAKQGDREASWPTGDGSGTFPKNPSEGKLKGPGEKRSENPLESPLAKGV